MEVRGRGRDLCHVARGPGRVSSDATRRRSSRGKMGSAVGRAGAPLPYMVSLSSLEEPVGAPVPQSHGRPVLGHT